MSDLRVRTARPDEVEAVGALTVAAYDADDHLTLADGHYDHGYAGFLAGAHDRAGRGVLLVAVGPDDVPLGTVTWCPPGSTLRELSDAEDQAEIRTLAVDPAARGRRVGGRLVDWCLAEARRAGLRQVLLCSLPSMRTAHGLYVARGFVRRPDLDWSPTPGVELWAFSLDL